MSRWTRLKHRTGRVKARFAKFPGVTPGHFTALPQPIPMVLAMMLSKVQRMWLKLKFSSHEHFRPGYRRH